MENENKIQKIKKENNKLVSKKLEYQLDLLLNGQKINREELRVGFRQPIKIVFYPYKTSSYWT